MRKVYLKLGLLVFGRLPTASSRGFVTSLIGGSGLRGLSRGLSFDTVPGISSPKTVKVKVISLLLSFSYHLQLIHH